MPPPKGEGVVPPPNKLDDGVAPDPPKRPVDGVLVPNVEGVVEEVEPKSEVEGVADVLPNNDGVPEPPPNSDDDGVLEEAAPKREVEGALVEDPPNREDEGVLEGAAPNEVVDGVPVDEAPNIEVEAPPKSEPPCVFDGPPPKSEVDGVEELDWKEKAIAVTTGSKERFFNSFGHFVKAKRRRSTPVLSNSPCCSGHCFER